MLAVSFTITDENGAVITQGRESLSTPQQVERFINVTMPGWGEVLRKAQDNPVTTKSTASVVDVDTKSTFAKNFGSEDA